MRPTPILALRVAMALILILHGWGAASAAPEPKQAPPLPAATGYTPIWFDDSATASDADMQTALDGLAAQEANPQHIAVLIHGFATPRADSTKQFNQMGSEIAGSFKKNGQRVAVLGIQWHSDVGPPNLWIVRVVTSVLGFSNDNPYLKKVIMAGNVGGVGARQMLQKVHQRFPGAQIDVFAHSLGCEVTRHIINPKAEASGSIKLRASGTLMPPYAPDVEIPLGVVTFCGADIDYDILYRNRDNPAFRDRIAVKLFWLTVGGVKQLDNKDLVLSLRALLRGDRAIGNQLPRMSVQQVDQMCANRLLVLDGQQIPDDHSILRYYDQKRVDRVVQAAASLTDSNVHSELLDTLAAIIKAPADPKVLVKFFEQQHISVQYYTLWRMESIYCGGPVHLADGYLELLSRITRDFPSEIKAQRWKGPCIVVREGFWPTQQQMDAAFAALPGLEGRPKPPDEPFKMP